MCSYCPSSACGECKKQTKKTFQCFKISTDWKIQKTTELLKKNVYGCIWYKNREQKKYDRTRVDSMLEGDETE